MLNIRYVPLSRFTDEDITEMKEYRSWGNISLEDLADKDGFNCSVSTIHTILRDFGFKLGGGGRPASTRFLQIEQRQIIASYYNNGLTATAKANSVSKWALLRLLKSWKVSYFPV